MKWLLISLCVLVSACAPALQNQSDPRTVQVTDPAFDEYIDLYISLKGSGFNYDIPIGFSKLDGNVIGLCTRWSNGYRQIQVDFNFWNDPATTFNQRKSLILHELGHCDLNRNHTQDKFPSGWPKSLMYPYNLGYLDNMESYYFIELFNPISTSSESKTYHNDCVNDI